MELVWETDAYSLWEDTARYIEREFGYIAMVDYINETANIEQQLMNNPYLGMEEPLRDVLSLLGALCLLNITN